MSHCDAILTYMRAHGGITQADAYRELACARLGARIFDLKTRGYQIQTIMQTGTNRFGEPTRWAKYVLCEASE